LKIESDNGQFNFRSVAVIIHQHHILVHKIAGDNFWVLPGGKVNLFEQSNVTLFREIKEELNLNCRVIRPLWYVESFFCAKGLNYHEVATYYLSKLTNFMIENVEYEFEGVEPNRALIFKWVSLEDVADLNLKPKFLTARLQNLPDHVEFIQVNQL
jgi:8-oxo-dGTP pyrophosphatase MutT (NUDIX family)